MNCRNRASRNISSYISPIYHRPLEFSTQQRSLPLCRIRSVFPPPSNYSAPIIKAPQLSTFSTTVGDQNDNKFCYLTASNLSQLSSLITLLFEMASSLALRRAANATSPLLKKLIDVGSLRPLSAAPTAARSFNTNAQMTAYDEGDRNLDVERRPSGVSRRRDSFPGFFSDVFDPFSPTRSVNQLLNMMDQFMENPFVAAREIGPAAISRRGWDVREDENSVCIKMDMPGIDKENVKITVEQNNTLVIKGEAEKESEDEEHRRRYSSRLDLPSDLYKLDEIKAEMKNGVLKVIVPKVKVEERKDVFQVKVE